MATSLLILILSASPYYVVSPDYRVALVSTSYSVVQTEGPVIEKPAAEKWVRVGEPTPVVVSCPTCPSGRRYTGETAQLWQWTETGQWAHIISDDSGVKGIWYYDGLSRTPRWVQAPKFTPEDKKFFAENHWRFSMPTCNMAWCAVHGGGWILESGRVPEK